MQFKSSLLLIAALAASTFARRHGHERRVHEGLTQPAEDLSKRDDVIPWTNFPNGQVSTAGFGGRTNLGGTGDEYGGNVGDPWGSNIILVPVTDAWQYNNVIQLQNVLTDPLTVVFWNKIGPDGGMNGWYQGNSALTFQLAPGELQYVAVDDNSRGAFSAAVGSLPVDAQSGYDSTWGEFDFANAVNGNCNGYDVSMIQAQAGGNQNIMGMSICQAPNLDCSSITNGATQINQGYTQAQSYIGGIGGNLPPGPMRLVATLGFNG